MLINSLLARIKNHKIAALLLNRETQTQIIRYLITGFSAFGAEYVVFAVLYSYIGLQDIYSNTIAMTVGFILSFTLNRIWSFRSRDNVLKQLLQFSILFVINLGISNLLIHVMSAILGITPLISKLIIMSAIVSWNFIIYKKVIYRL